MNTTTIHSKAFLAIHAANNYHVWGRYATFEYARKHGIMGLLVTALQLQRMQAVENLSFVA